MIVFYEDVPNVNIHFYIYIDKYFNDYFGYFQKGKKPPEKGG